MSNSPQEVKGDDTSSSMNLQPAPTNTKAQRSLTRKRSTLIPLPDFCKTKKCRTCWQITKYTYVIGVIIFGFLIVILTQLSDSIDEWFDSQQRIILRFLTEESVFYIILVLLGITTLKSFGLKDVLGLRTISVAILAYTMVSSSRGTTLLLSMFIIGILSSVSKLIEYQVIGHELQVVQGKPIEFICKYLRMLLEKCIKAENVVWLDPKYTFKISLKSRFNKEMHIMANIKDILQPYLSKCCHSDKDNIEQSIDVPRPPNNDYSNTPNTEEKTNIDMETPENGNGNGNDKFEWTLRNVLFFTLYFFISVIWTSVIEWVQPITELFMFAHNWDLSFRSAIIIVLSEFADFDKAVETWFIINGLYTDSDIISAKVDAVASKGVFWTLGYCIVAPPTLIWAYLYYTAHKEEMDRNEEEMASEINEFEMNSKHKKNKNKNKTNTIEISNGHNQGMTESKSIENFASI